MAEPAVECTAPPERLWELVARPDHWSQWSPHVRRAEGLGSPEVVEGARGTVVLRGGVKLRAVITEVVPGRSWSWRVGGLSIDHVITPTAGGSRLEMPVKATGRLWMPAAAAYAPLVAAIARRIARIAERGPG